MTAWWQRGAIYQIYPRSFADGDGDGVGDLRGIAARLDHLSELGVAAIWLSPIYTSPMADFGYDVADYRDVDPTFGTLADFDELVAACHARDIRVVIDWVPNHSSDEHPWFRASRSSRDDPKRDWYVWHDGAGGRAGIGRRRRTTGARSSARSARRGRSTSTPGSGTCTRSFPSSRTSTGTTPPSRRPCTTCCASGCGGASTAFASTRCSASPTIRCCATTRAPRAAATRTGRPPTTASAGSVGSWRSSTTG